MLDMKARIERLVSNLHDTVFPKASRGHAQSGFPEKFDPAHKFTTFVYKGTLGDIKAEEPPLPGVWCTEQELNESEEFWYSEERVANVAAERLLPRFQILAREGDKRGTFKVLNDHVRLWACLTKIQKILEGGPGDLPKFKRAISSVEFEVLPSAGNAIADFWVNWQAGEDKDKEATENSNSFTFRRYEKLEYFQLLLQTTSGGSTYLDIANAFAEQEKKGVITFANKKNKIGGEATVKKLMYMGKRLKDAKVYTSLA